MDIKQMGAYDYEERKDVIMPAKVLVKPGKSMEVFLEEWREMLNEEFTIAHANDEDFIYVPLSYLGKMPDAIRIELNMGGYKVKKKWFGGYIITAIKDKTS